MMDVSPTGVSAATTFEVSPNTPARLSENAGVRYQRATPRFLMGVCLRIILLLFFAPLMLFISLAVYLTKSGPILIRSEGPQSGTSAAKSFVFRTDADQLCGFACVEGNTRDNPLWLFLRNSELYKLPRLLNLFDREPLIDRWRRA
jgi:lipopolysaccharide/colanic/teichoic acid biosynthesis glycosyltransferase